MHAEESGFPTPAAGYDRALGKIANGGDCMLVHSVIIVQTFDIRTFVIAESLLQPYSTLAG